MLDEKQKLVHRKFASESWLSSEKHIERLIEWTTFFRRNIHLFVITYLGINLHPFQTLWLYLMGICPVFVSIAARGASKSFVLAIYACAKAILYPRSSIIVCSGTRGQAKLIVNKKIKSELCSMSSALRREIRDVVDGEKTVVAFRNDSTITVVTANDSARGNRGNTVIFEEYRLIEKQIYDEVLVPIATVRPAPYMSLPYYSDVAELIEEPQLLYISSSWRANHWMWEPVRNALKDMLSSGVAFVLAFDYSIVLRHRIKTRQQLIQAKKNADPLSWALEYMNLRLKQDESAFFDYDLFAKRQNLVQAFYPLVPGASPSAKPRNVLPRQSGEVRIVTADLAMMSGRVNDASCYGLLRCLPETVYSESNNTNKFGYHVQIPYLETWQGKDQLWQTLRLKMLMEVFDANYLVMDARNFGLSVYEMGCRVLYDSDRQKEYKPWLCMNNDDIAKRINSGADPNVYCITAGAALNSSIADNMRLMLSEGRVDLLINHNAAIENLQVNNPEYLSADPETQLSWEHPYMETMLLINECTQLNYEKTSTGLTRLVERVGSRKDRYSSVGYGLYFVSQLELDMQNDDDFDLGSMPFLVSTLP